jgi:AcrR family transcriptional regulator
LRPPVDLLGGQPVGYTGELSKGPQSRRHAPFELRQQEQRFSPVVAGRLIGCRSEHDLAAELSSVCPAQEAGVLVDIFVLGHGVILMNQCSLLQEKFTRMGDVPATTTEPPRSSRTERRKARTRGAILDAAESLFAASGYGGTGVDDVAEQADVAVGSIYSYFGSKDGLYRAVIERALEDDRAAMDAAHRSASALDRLGAVGEALSQLHREHPILFRLSIAGPFDGALDAIPDLAHVIEDLTRAELARLEATIAAGIAEGVLRPVDPASTAAFLWASWRGMTALSLRPAPLGIDQEQLATITRTAIDLITKGLVIP